MAGRKDSTKVYRRAMRAGLITRRGHWWLDPHAKAPYTAVYVAARFAREMIRRGIVPSIETCFAAVRSRIELTEIADDVPRELERADEALAWAKSEGAV